MTKWVFLLLIAVLGSTAFAEVAYYLPYDIQGANQAKLENKLCLCGDEGHFAGDSWCFQLKFKKVSFYKKAEQLFMVYKNKEIPVGTITKKTIPFRHPGAQGEFYRVQLNSKRLQLTHKRKRKLVFQKSPNGFPIGFSFQETGMKFTLKLQGRFIERAYDESGFPTID